MFALKCAATVAVTLAISIRAIAALDQPWLDEIWSLTWAREAHSALQIITNPAFDVDNNHWLNSLWLHCIGPRTRWFWYRFPALLSGVGLMVMCGVTARRWGRAAAVLAVFLIGFSYMFVVYASEARGYGPVVLFGVVAFWSLRWSVVDKRGWPATVLFGVASVMGFLSHASFVYAFTGSLVYAPVALFRRQRPIPSLVRIVTLFAVPGVFFAWLYFTAIAHMEIAGSTRGTSVVGMLADLLTYVFGTPAEWPAATWIGLAVVSAGTVHGCRIMARQNCDEWVFLLTAGVIAPALLIAIRQPDPLFARYVFAGMPFVLLLLAVAGADLLNGRTFERVLVGTCVGVFLAGNAVHLWPFLRLGRGHNLEAIAYLVDQTTSPAITYDAPDRPSTDILFSYFASRSAMRGKTLEFAAPTGSDAAEWFVVNRYSQNTQPPTVYPRGMADPYHLAAVFPHAGISGCDWFLYRRAFATTQRSNANAR